MKTTSLAKRLSGPKRRNYVTAEDTEPVTARLDLELIEQLNSISEALNVSRARLVAAVLEDSLPEISTRLNQITAHLEEFTQIAKVASTKTRAKGRAST